MTENIYLSIIIPAYNEASRISNTLDAIYSYLSKKTYSYEIIVVDDGSTDETFKQAELSASKFKKIKILKNEKNMGKGYSVKRGMLEATGELKLFIDADHSVNIENIDRFIENIDNGADICIGSIEISKTAKTDSNPGYRLVMGKLSKILIRMLAVPEIYDSQRGFKLFKRVTADAIFPKQTIHRWGFDIEVLVIARQKGYVIKELGVEWNNSESSSLNIFSYIPTLLELLRIKKNQLTSKY